VNDRKPSLLLDAKYKDQILEDDLYQMWIYCIVYSLPKGILVYPKHATISDEIRTLRTARVKSIIRNIDLNKHNMQEFEECTRFSREIELVINNLAV
jgi:5-methylcytosine-specific restriction endonuclease McrBC regulatory subunit McrC